MALHSFLWGLSLGWLAGLADAQAVSTLLTALLALFTGASTLAASKQKATIGAKSYALEQSHAGPITAAVVGLAIGFPLGVLAQRRWLTIKPGT